MLAPGIYFSFNSVGRRCANYVYFCQWNREDCRNAIVVVWRGPGDPDYLVSFALKIHHAQMAGAKAVVIIDGVSTNFDMANSPTAGNGPIDYGIKPDPPETHIEIRIPAVMILREKAHLLREKVVHMLHWLDPGTCAGLPDPKKARVGYVFIPKQESKIGMEKSQAQALMAEFFAERRKERSEETSMLMDAIHTGRDQAEETLKSREFYGGSFFSSMNPFKGATVTENLDRHMQDHMMNKLKNMPGVGELQKNITLKMEVLRQDIEAFLPVTVSWHEHDDDEESARPKEDPTESSYSISSLKKAIGFQMPTIVPKDPKGDFVWCATGQPPFWLRICVGETTEPLRLTLTGYEYTYQHVQDPTKLAIRMGSIEDGKFVTSGVQLCELLVEGEKCELNFQKKMTIVISVNTSGYHVTVRHESSLKDKVWFMPHNVTLEKLSLDRLSRLPLEAFFDGSMSDHPAGTGCKFPKISRLPPAEGIYKPPPKPLFQWNIEDWVLVFRHTALGILN